MKRVLSSAVVHFFKMALRHFTDECGLAILLSYARAGVPVALQYSTSASASELEPVGVAASASEAFDRGNIVTKPDENPAVFQAVLDLLDKARVMYKVTVHEPVRTSEEVGVGFRELFGKVG